MDVQQAIEALISSQVSQARKIEQIQTDLARAFRLIERLQHGTPSSDGAKDGR